MRFSVLATLSTVIALVGQGSAYVVFTYPTFNCDSEPTMVNVWDDTCATWMGSFHSMRVEAFGGKGQRALLYSGINCDSLDTFVNAMADGTDPKFQLGKCISFPTGPIMTAMRSIKYDPEIYRTMNNNPSIGNSAGFPP